MPPHDHDHDHDHAHDHGAARRGSHEVRRRLAATLAVTFVLMVAEAVGGWLSGSLALLADAGHMLTDLLALAVAFAAVSLATRPADGRATYGYRRIEILAALFNGVTLVGLSVSIVLEALDRWFEPRPVDTALMAVVAALGLLGNLVGIWLLSGSWKNLSARGALLHVLGDALTSVGVLAGAAFIALTGWTRADVLVSGLIAVVIVATSLMLLRDVVNVLLEAAPRGLDTEEIRKAIRGIPGVSEVHDLHVWSITTGMPALSAHVVVPLLDPQLVRSDIQGILRERYAIAHATLQIESQTRADCGACH